MLIPRSALDAFRQDLAAEPTTAGPADARWLQVVTLLQSALDVAPSQRDPILGAATGLAAPDALAPDAAVLPLPVTLSFAPPPMVEMAIRTAIAMEDGARFHLAYAAYDAALRLVVSELEDDAKRIEVQGVILALQGRTARQIGDVEAATKHYEAAEKLGRDGRVDSVVARAWVGLGLLAQIRGNHPEARRRFTQSLGLTGAAPESRQVAHQGLMVSASAAGDYDMAALHAWAAYELAPAGDEKVSALCDVAELLRTAGHPAVALRGFSAAMLRAPRSARQLLPALGGAALAAAQALPRASARPLVDGFAVRVESIAEQTPLPYPLASAFADLGEAYELLGQDASAAGFRSRARTIAERFGFFELVYRVTEGVANVAAAAARPAAPAPLGAARSVVTAVSAFETPAEVELALAAAGV